MKGYSCKKHNLTTLNEKLERCVICTGEEDE